MSRLFLYANLDATVGLRVDDPTLEALAGDLHSAALSSVADCPPDAEADLAWSDAKDDLVQISLRGEAWETPMAAADAFFQSENLLTRLFCSKLTGLLQLHAAAVADDAGRAWLICGPSRAGKTSLALSLMLEGWNWLTDELVLVDEAAPTRLKGFKRNFNLKEPSWPLFPETDQLPHRRESWSGHHQANIRFIDPEALKPDSFVPEADLAGILLPAYSEDGDSPVFEKTPGMAATQALLPEVTAPSASMVSVIAGWARDVPVLRVTYNNPREIPASLRESHPFD